MRCTKCGYDGTGNIPGGTCIKCGTRLVAIESAPVSGVNQPFPQEINVSQSRPTMRDIRVPEDLNLKATRIVGTPEPKSPLKQTVIQGGASGIGGQMRSTVIQRENTSSTPSPLAIDDSGELVCPKCGYPLADHYTSCPNCGADFSGENEEEPLEENNVQEMDSQPSSSMPSKKERKKKKEDEKVVQGTVGLGALKKEESNSDEEFLCTCDNCGEELSAAFRFCPKCGTEIRQKTLHGFRHKKKKEEAEDNPQPTIKREFKLTIIPDEGEGIEPVVNHFEGSEVMLNRKNTEPDNRTITSKEQAVVFCDQGKWFIENRSEYDSTMILANRKMEIQNGDIIMLGDRRFKFESEESEQK